jgi:hypothetical protein
MLLAAGGLAVSTAASGATTARAPAASVPKLSHQLCYLSGAVGFKIPSGVKLFNAFAPNGFVPKIGPAVMTCNPVIKTISVNGKTKVFPITNKNGHLACFSITAKQQKLPAINVSNQFGKGLLIPSQPNLLCLPTWKTLLKPPVEKTPQPPGLDHFTCYPVKSQGKFVVPPLTLQDEFGKSKPDVKNVPTLLCLPTKKVIGKKTFKVLHPKGLLVCFPVGPTPIKNPVFELNQFGRARVTIKKTNVLCLPSVRVPAGKTG